MLTAIPILLVLLLAGCGTASDPVPASYFESLYSEGDVGIDGMLAVEGDLTTGSDVMPGGELILTNDPPITLSGDGRVWLEFRPDLDPTKLSVNAKPTMVERGICIGYSLPIGGADEELFYGICVPNRWEEQSDIHIHIHAWLDTAQDEDTDAVKLSLNWQQVSIGEAVPNTYSTVVDEVVTGVVAQYTAIEFDFILDYDIIPADPIEIDDRIFFHLTRIASSHEIEGEPVIYHAGVIFRRDKLGAAAP